MRRHSSAARPAPPLSPSPTSPPLFLVQPPDAWPSAGSNRTCSPRSPVADNTPAAVIRSLRTLSATAPLLLRFSSACRHLSSPRHQRSTGDSLTLTTHHPGEKSPQRTRNPLPKTS